MKLKCLGSGSSGNCYILENDMEALVIEAGLPFMDVKKALDFNVRKIIGVICTHRHKDHSKFLKDFVVAGIRSIAPSDYWIENILEWWFQYGEHYDETRKCIEIGNFKIIPFQLVHDVPCYGFYIQHPEMGTLIYASDTEYIRYRFKDVNHILVECNYDKNFIQDDAVNRTHVLEGHMELQTTKEFVKVNNNPDLRNVVLLHLSANNSNPGEFKEEMEKIIDCPVWIAEKGLEVDLRLVPF